MKEFYSKCLQKANFDWFVNSLSFWLACGKGSEKFYSNCSLPGDIFEFFTLSAAFYPLHRSRQCDTGALEPQLKWLIDYLSLGVELLSSGKDVALGRRDFVVWARGEVNDGDRIKVHVDFCRCLQLGLVKGETV